MSDFCTSSIHISHHMAVTGIHVIPSPAVHPFSSNHHATEENILINLYSDIGRIKHRVWTPIITRRSRLTSSWINHKEGWDGKEPAWWRTSWEPEPNHQHGLEQDESYCKSAAGGFRYATGFTPGADWRRVTMTDRCQTTPKRKRRVELTAHPVPSWQTAEVTLLQHFSHFTWMEYMMIRKQETANSLGSHRWWLSRCLTTGEKQMINVPAWNLHRHGHFHFNRHFQIIHQLTDSLIRMHLWEDDICPDLNKDGHHISSSAHWTKTKISWARLQMLQLEARVCAGAELRYQAPAHTPSQPIRSSPELSIMMPRPFISNWLKLKCW